MGALGRNAATHILVPEPQLLLLDEPFGALDAFTREDLWEILQNLWMKERPTVILVTHDLREATFLADTVYVFSERPGRVLSKTDIGFARPRTLETAFEPEFIKLVQSLRGQIARA